MKLIKRAGDLRVMGTAAVQQKSACQMGIVRKQALFERWWIGATSYWRCRAELMTCALLFRTDRTRRRLNGDRQSPRRGSRMDEGCTSS